MISESELRELESTLLPALERHHLRLLAHGLRTLQAVARTPGAALTNSGLPDRTALERWAESQPALADDPAFRDTFIDQLLGVAVQLERIAADRGPLALELADLVLWARSEADRRVSGITTASPPPG